MDILAASCVNKPEFDHLALPGNSASARRAAMSTVTVPAAVDTVRWRLALGLRHLYGLTRWIDQLSLANGATGAMRRPSKGGDELV